MWPIIIIFSTFVVASFAQLLANSTTPTNGKRIIAYYQNYKGVPIADIDGDKITHFIYTFLIFDNSTLDIKDGDTWLDEQKLYPSDNPKCGCCAKGNYNQVYQLKSKYPHLKTILSIGGWVNSGPISVVVSTPEGRTKMVTQSTQVMREFGFDGIDIDWEFPISGGIEGGSKSPNDGANLVLLLEAYRSYWAQVDPLHRYELTVAMPYARQSYLTGDYLQRFNNQVDYILVMSYEFQFGSDVSRPQANLYPSSSDSTSNALLNVDRGIKTYLMDGMLSAFNNSKVILGIPCYGRGFANVTAGTRNGLYSSFTGKVGDLIEYRNISTLLSTGFQQYYDSETKSSYFYNAQSQMFYSIETGISAAEKAKYVNDNNLGGIMLWDITTDLPSSDPNSILNNVYQNLQSIDKTPVNRGDQCSAPISTKCNIGCMRIPASVMSDSNVKVVPFEILIFGLLSILFTSGWL